MIVMFGEAIHEGLRTLGARSPFTRLLCVVSMAAQDWFDSQQNIPRRAPGGNLFNLAYTKSDKVVYTQLSFSTGLVSPWQLF